MKKLPAKIKKGDRFVYVGDVFRALEDAFRDDKGILCVKVFHGRHDKTLAFAPYEENNPVKIMEVN